MVKVFEAAEGFAFGETALLYNVGGLGLHFRLQVVYEYIINYITLIYSIELSII